MVFVIAAAGYLLGSAPFAAYVARIRNPSDAVALAPNAERP
jgi:glycerol-3-phosphate acyltransferase PlsY